jgi:hypothetical protein
MVGLPGRAEFFQQVRQYWIDVGERDSGRLATAPASQSVQNQQRLVRGALAAAAPDVEPSEAFQDGLASHWSLRHMAGWRCGKRSSR